MPLKGGKLMDEKYASNYLKNIKLEPNGIQIKDHYYSIIDVIAVLQKVKTLEIMENIKKEIKR